MTGQVSRTTDFETGDNGLYLDTCGCSGILLMMTSRW